MNHVYAVSEVIGSSAKGIEDAIQNAVATAATHIRNMDWFEVTEIRGHLNKDGSVAHYQVGVKLGFRYERH
ncbi:MAG: dodecin [Alphaproteobacteria bacterium]